MHTIGKLNMNVITHPHEAKRVLHFVAIDSSSFIWLIFVAIVCKCCPKSIPVFAGLELGKNIFDVALSFEILVEKCWILFH